LSQGSLAPVLWYQPQNCSNTPIWFSPFPFYNSVIGRRYFSETLLRLLLSDHMNYISDDISCFTPSVKQLGIHTTWNWITASLWALKIIKFWFSFHFSVSNILLIITTIIFIFDINLLQSSYRPIQIVGKIVPNRYKYNKYFTDHSKGVS